MEEAAGEVYDVVVVGGGIAGLTAAIYACRAGRSVLVLEAEACGGQIISTLDIENYPAMMGVSGAELGKKLETQAEELGAEVEYEEVLKVVKDGDGFLVKTDDGEYRARKVVIATGAKEKKLGLAREDELVGRGVSYCATCDGAFYKGKTVAVIGGGNTALADALYLADLCEKVYLVHRRDEFRGDAAEVEKLRQRGNVEFVLGYVPSEILGEAKVTGLKLVPSGLAGSAEEGRELAVDGMFVAIGRVPATGAFVDLVELDSDGYVVAGEDCQTSCPGVLVAGDCRTKDVRQLVTAAGDGAVAAAGV